MSFLGNQHGREHKIRDKAKGTANKGLAYIELGKYEQAITDFDKAVELDPSLQK